MFLVAPCSSTLAALFFALQFTLQPVTQSSQVPGTPADTQNAQVDSQTGQPPPVSQPPSDQPKTPDQPPPSPPPPPPAEPAKPDPAAPADENSDVVNDRIFGVLPNYSTVKEGAQVPPIRDSQVFKLAALNSFDPYVFPFVAGVAGLAHLRNQDPSWGRGFSGYGKRYSSALADNTIGNFFTTAIMPAALKQDPRYYELGSGGFWHRLGYATSRAAVTRSRDGHPQFNLSEIGGNFAGAVISNAWYPIEERNVGATFERGVFQILYDTGSNVMKEFWPDIHEHLHLHRQPAQRQPADRH